MLSAQTPQYPLLNSEVLAEPHALYHRMRQEDPVHWSDAIQAWILTRYDDVCQAFNEPRLSNRKLDILLKYQLAGQDAGIVRDYARVVNGMMLLKDGQDHHRLRVLGNRGFTPTLMENFRAV